MEKETSVGGRKEDLQILVERTKIIIYILPEEKFNSLKLNGTTNCIVPKVNHLLFHDLQ